MHVVLLQRSAPECGKVAADKMIPADGLLVMDELVVGFRVLFKFFCGKVCIVKVGGHAGK